MITLQDNFVGANGPITGHSPQIGGPYVMPNGNVAIAGNKAVFQDGGAGLNEMEVNIPNLGNLAIPRVDALLEVIDDTGLNISLQLNGPSVLSYELQIKENDTVLNVGTPTMSPQIIFGVGIGVGNHPISLQQSDGRISFRAGPLSGSFQAELSLPEPITQFDLEVKATNANSVALRNLVVQGQTR